LTRPTVVPPYRVLIHGLPYFGRMLGDLLRRGEWDIRHHLGRNPLDLIALVRDLHRCDLVYKIGGRIAGSKFLQAAKFVGKDKIIMHWVGSDVLFAQRYLSRGGKPDPWVVHTVHHWAEVSWIAEEVRGFGLGLECDIVPVGPAHIPDSPPPLPEVFSVLVYLPLAQKAALYGLDMILQVARQLPSVHFQLAGTTKDQISDAPPNLKILGWVADTASLYRQISVLWRPVQHDGLSCMVLEALAYGRHVLYSYPFPGCIRVGGAAEACQELRRLSELHQQKCLEVNQTGLRVVSEQYHPRRIKEEMLRRFKQVILSG